MVLLYSSLFRNTLLLLVLFCAPSLLLFNPIIKAQEFSREEAIKEAGRLGTEAERLRGEAYKKVQAGGDRKLIAEAELAGAEKLRTAIELWRAAGDDGRLVGGVEELTRIYSVYGDYEGVIRSLTREAEYWGKRGDLSRQTHTLWLMGIRQTQMGRDKAAVETLERVIAMSRAASLASVESNALEETARLYEKFGRGEEARQSRLSAGEARLRMFAQSQNVSELPKPAKPVLIPTQWIDLPTAPFVAEYREIEGVSHAVLINRSTKGIEMVSFGCVTEEDGKTRVLNGLVGMGRNHGGVGPGSYYSPFTMLNGPLNRWTDEKMGCEGSAKIAVTEATFADGTKWNAEGGNWFVR